MVAMDGTADVEVLPSARVNVALDRPRHHDVYRSMAQRTVDLRSGLAAVQRTAAGG